MIKYFQDCNTETGECIEYGCVIELTEIENFMMVLSHIEAKYGRKVTAYVTTEYYNKLINDIKFDDNPSLIGIPIVIENEQAYELIVKY